MLNISTAAPLLAAALTTLAPPMTSVDPPTTTTTTATAIPTLNPPSTTTIPTLDPSNTTFYNITDLEETEKDLSEDSGYAAFLAGSRYVVQRVLVPVVLVVGVVGNAVTIVVLTRRQMRSSTNNYLTALAISDLLYLVFIFSLSIRHHPGMSRPHHWFYWHYFRYALWLTDASSEYKPPDTFLVYKYKFIQMSKCIHTLMSKQPVTPNIPTVENQGYNCKKPRILELTSTLPL